jgi:hypothetical protein
MVKGVGGKEQGAWEWGFRNLDYCLYICKKINEF